MKTSTLWSRTLHLLVLAMFGVMLSPTGLAFAEDKLAWDKTFPQSDKAEHSKVTFHTDLCDRTDIIPFDKMTKFFNEYLK